MRKDYFLITCFLFSLVNCKKEATSDLSKQVPALNDQSMDSFIVQLEPIGEYAGGVFYKFSGDPKGCLSLFDKKSMDELSAEKMQANIDAICYISPGAFFGMGDVWLVLPQTVKEAVGLNWQDYTTTTKLLNTVYSKRPYDNNNFYTLSEQEFFQIKTPEQIKDYIQHTLRVNPGLEVPFLKLPYFVNKIENNQIFAIKDSKGHYSIVRIEAEQNNLSFQITVKRSYATNP